MSKKFNVKVDPKNVVYTNISTSADGYNSARIVSRMGDKEYLVVNYEWEGTVIPDFAVNLMTFMQKNGVETSGLWPEKEELISDIPERLLDK
jgi:hypothetical protein